MTWWQRRGSFPQVRLNSIVTFDHIETGTRIVERMRVQAPRPLAGVTAREATKAHIAMLSGIRRIFNEGRPRVKRSSVSGRIRGLIHWRPAR